MLAAVPTGVAPTVSVNVNELPAHPAAEVGIIVYTTVSFMLPVLVSVSKMSLPHPAAQSLYPVTLADEPLAVQVNKVVPEVPADNPAVV